MDIENTKDDELEPNQMLLEKLRESIKGKLQEKHVIEEEEKRNNEAIKQKEIKLPDRRRFRKKIFIAVGTFICTMGMLMTGVYVAANQPENIIINIQDVTMVEGEAVPEFQVEILYEGNGQRILDRSSGYEVGSLLEELLTGSTYTLSVNDEELLSGSHPICLEWLEEAESKLKSWEKKINIIVTEGNLLVQYDHGYLLDEIFYSWNDEVITEEWVVYEGEEIYIGESGNVNTDTLTQGMVVYKFDENGKVISKETKPDPDLPMVAITVDDGPSSYTPKLLEAMEKYGIHITFFVLGNKINDGSKEILEEIIRLGGEIANHSYSHPSFTTLTNAEIASQMKRSEDAIYKQTGQYTTIMRLPYGATNANVAAQLDKPLIFWSVDTEDWSNKSKKETLKKLTTNIKDGDILLAHDIHEWSVKAIVEAIPILIEQGFQLVTVSEMAEAKGVEMKKGTAYHSFRQ